MGNMGHILKIHNKLYYFQNRDIFMWSDGWRTTYLNWGQQNNQNEQSCVQMNVTNGKWDAINCDMSLPYMCKFSKGI